MVILNMSYIFNYNDFYNYYTNPSNVITDTSDCVSLYYFMDSDKIKKMNISNPKWKNNIFSQNNPTSNE